MQHLERLMAGLRAFGRAWHGDSTTRDNPVVDPIPVPSGNAALRLPDNGDGSLGDSTTQGNPAVDPIPLPSGYAVLRLRDGEGGSFDVVRSEPPTEYETSWMAGSDWGTHAVVWLLRRCLGPNGFLVDLGANIGSVSLPVAASGTPVLAVEMLPANCLKLHLAARLNAGARLHVVQAAVSSEDGLIQYGGTQAWGSVGTGQETATALRLDTLLGIARGQDPTLADRTLVIKLDVEGHEFEVLRGARDLLAREKPAILFESIEYADGGPDQQAKQCKNLLQNLGYTLYAQRHRTLVPRRATDLQESLVVDFLALPPHRADVLTGVEVRALTDAERVGWIDEMTKVGDALHQRHAVAAVAALRAEDARHVEGTEPLLARLRSSPFAEVQAALRAQGAVSPVAT